MAKIFAYTLILMGICFLILGLVFAFLISPVPTKTEPGELFTGGALFLIMGLAMRSAFKKYYL
jgi:hypothetical protein